MWNDKQMALKQRISDLSLEERRALCAVLLEGDNTGERYGGIEVIDAQLTAERIVNLLQNANADCKEVLKRVLGSCGVSGCKHKPDRCYNRRMSVLEEERLRSDIGGAIDIPAVTGAGGVVVVNVPAYGIEYYLEQFSMDGQLALNTGSLTRVSVVVSHAGFPLATFRVSEYLKPNCCVTIVNAFKKQGMCFGWGSAFTITVTNNNALVGEAFVNGVFSYIRGYPDPDGST